MSQFFSLPLIGLVLLVVMMVVLWGISLKIRNAAVVDVGWGSAMVVLGLLYAVMSDGYLPRRVALAAMTTAWGLRLAGYLFFTRIWGQPEEGRYKQLREEWGPNADKKLLGFFLMQATVAVVMSVVDLSESGRRTISSSVLRVTPPIRAKFARAGYGITRGIRITFLSG
jgi:steroid 5-alpha reductase family enzyme